MTLTSTGRRWRRAALALVAAGALTLSACGSSSDDSTNTGASSEQTSAGGDSNTDEPTSSDNAVPTGNEASQDASPREATNSLIAVAVQDPGAFDYVTDTKTAVALWVPSIVEPLLYFDADGNATPGVSDSWTISDDGLVYEFHIRDTTFSDGSPVTADDVVFSLKTMQESPLVRLSSVFAPVQSIEKVDDATVRVTLDRPSQAFFQGMGDFSGFVQPEAGAATRASNPIGTGPYKLVKYVPQDSIQLTANENYWGEQPKIKDVTIRIIEDESAAMLAMQAGEADMFVPAGAQFWSQIVDEGLDQKYNLITYPQAGEPTYGIINQRVPLEKRQVIAAVFNRDDIKALFNAPWGIETACTFARTDRSWYLPYTDNGAENCAYPYDPQGAAETVAANGWGSDEIVFTSLTDVGDLKPPAEVMIAEMQAAGFNVTNNAIDLARYSATVFSADDPDYDVTVMAGSDTPSAWTCPDGKSGWGTYCNPAYDELLNKADQALTSDEYADYMAQAAAQMAKDAVLVPLLSKQSAGLLHPDLNGWTEPNVFVGIRLADLSW